MIGLAIHLHLKSYKLSKRNQEKADKQSELDMFHRHSITHLMIKTTTNIFTGFNSNSQVTPLVPCVASHLILLIVSPPGVPELNLKVWFYLPIN